MERRLIVIAAMNGFLAVVLGAFGTHTFKTRLAPEMLTIFETGVRYQIYHAFALLCVGLIIERRPSTCLKWAGRLFILGIIIFSGSLYLLALTGHKWFGAITPFGGAAFLAGWATLAVSAWRTEK